MPEKETDQNQQNSMPGVDLSHPAFSNTGESYEPTTPSPEIKNVADGITEPPKPQNYFDEQPAQPETTKSEMQYYDDVPASNFGKNKLALIIAGGILFILLIAGGSFLLLGSKKNVAEEKETTTEEFSEEKSAEEEASEATKPEETETLPTSSSSPSQSTPAPTPPAVEKKPIETPQPETPPTNPDGSVNASG